MATTTKIEGVYEIRIEQGPALRAFETLKKDLDQTKAGIRDLNKEQKGNIATVRSLEKAIKDSGTATAEETKLLQDARAEQERVNKLLSEAVLREKALSGQTRELSNDLSGLTANGLRFRDKMADANLEALKGSGILGQLAAQERSLKVELEALNTKLGEGAIKQEQYDQELKRITGDTEAVRAKSAGLEKEIEKLNAEFRDGKISQEQYREGLGRIEASTNSLGTKFDAFAQNQGRELKSTLSSLALQYVGVGAAITGLVSIAGDAVSTIKNFEQAQANLASILGKTRSEITALTDSAIAIGPALGRAPEEVSQLQTELAKLGFTKGQILAAQEAVILLANATGESLPKSAEVAAATIKGMGLTADDTQRVVDVMAQSFNSTSLDLEKFSVAMSTVAPAAKAAGFSLEETTSLIGVLSDRGLDASVAGTALRSMFIDLSKTGMSLDEALDLIQNSTNKTKTAFELFGERAAGSAVILAENREETNRAADALDRAGGAAKKMADEQLSTLTGATNQLTASWDAFILSLDKGDGALGSTLQTLVKLGAAAIQVASGIEGANDVLNNMVLEGNKKVFDDLTAFSQNATEGQLRALQGTVAARIKVLKAGFDELDGAAKVKVEEDLRKQVMAFDELTKAIRSKNKASGQGGEIVAGAEVAATATQAKTVAQLREELKGLKDAREEIAVTDADALATNAKMTSALEIEIDRIDGKTKKTKELTAEQKAQLELQKELASLSSGKAVVTKVQQSLETLVIPQDNSPEQDALKSGLIALSDIQEDYRIKQLEGTLTFNDERRLLDAEYFEAKLIGQEEYNARAAAITAKFEEQQTAAEQQLLASAADTLGNIASLTKEGSAEYKALALAQTLVNTYMSATAAFAAQQVPGDPSSLPRGIGAAALAVVNGLINVAKIKGFAGGGEVTSSWGTPVTRSNGDNVLVRTGDGGHATLQTDEIVVSRKSRAKAERTYGSGIWADMGIPGFHAPMRDFRRHHFERGYADGGVVGLLTPRPSPSTVVSNQLVSSMEAFAERPIWISAREMSDVQSRIQTQEDARTL